MSGITLKAIPAASIPTPATDKNTLFFDDSTGEPSYKDDAGTVTSLAGIPGQGVPVGGTTGQVLAKVNGTDYNTTWVTPSGGTYTGTAGSITLTGSAFSIDATYVGQTSITTLGTVATGTWNATAIGATKGGTGQTGYAVGDLLYASTTTALSKLAAGTNGHVLTLSGGVPVWAAGGGGGGSPAGSNLQVQYNNGGSFGAEAAFAYDQSTNTLSVDNISMNGLLLTLASATGAAGIRIPHGTAPSAPTNGDFWSTTAGFYGRVNGTTVGPFGASGGGSLTNWTEAVNGSSPNATIPVVSFVATNAATNVDAVLKAKGNGGVGAQVADSTTTGGNKRGRNSVDWQSTRSAGANVASGDNATIGGGDDNKADNLYSTVAGGTGNIAGNTAAAVGGGSGNTASGSSAVIAGGSGNTATNTNAAVLGGSGNQATGQYSGIFAGLNGRANADYATVSGGRSATARSCKNADARAAMTFLVAASDTQRREFIFLADTTDNTPEAMTADNGTAAAGNTIVLPDSSVYIVKGYVSARQQSTGDVKGWSFEVMIKRDANAASTAIVGTPTITVIGASAGLGSTNATGSVIGLSANTTLGGLAITITGETSKNIKWAARIIDLENVTA